VLTIPVANGAPISRICTVYDACGRHIAATLSQVLSVRVCLQAPHAQRFTFRRKILLKLPRPLRGKNVNAAGCKIRRAFGIKSSIQKNNKLKKEQL
jgi:hypothetical protein